MNFSSAITYRVPRAFFKAAEYFSDAIRLGHTALIDKELGSVIFARDSTPPEGSRFRRGDRLRLYSPSGESRRLKVYRVLSGGFSNVYLVLDLDETKFYCLKENRALPVAEDRKNSALEREARILFAISPHPNIVQPVSSHYLNGKFMILSEYVRGWDLNSEIGDPSFDARKCLSYAVQICDAIEHARCRAPGFVHGDIKPGNCLIDTRGQLKITDLGQASTAAEPDREHGGTIGYMAPELHSARNVDGGVDVYAFGITLFEMLLGKRPFDAASKSEIAELHCTAKPPLEELETIGVHPDVIALISECLEKEPSRRPGDFSEIRDRLIRVLRSEYGVDVLSSGPLRTEGTGTADQSFNSAPDSPELAPSGDRPGALRSIDPSHRLGNPLLLEQKAAVLQRSGRRRAAIRYIKAAISLDKRRAEAWAALAQIRLEQGSLRRALWSAERGLSVSPDDPSLLALAGKACFAMGRYEEAVGRLKVAVLNLDADHETFKTFVRACVSVRPAFGIDANSKQVRTLVRAVRPGSQKRTFKSATALFSENVDPPALLWLLFCLDEFIIRSAETLRGRDRLAVAAQLRSVASYALDAPRSIEGLSSLGKLLYEFDERALCSTIMTLILETDPGNAAACYYRGVCAEGEGHLEKALAFYEKSLRSNPRHEITRFAVRRVRAKVDALPETEGPHPHGLELEEVNG